LKLVSGIQQKTSSQRDKGKASNLKDNIERVSHIPLPRSAKKQTHSSSFDLKVKENETKLFVENSPKKFRESQLRIAGMTKALKSLEAENKDKDMKIAQLNEKLKDKQRIIESLQSKLETNQNRSFAPTIGSTAQRNRERELEKKVKELEEIIAKEKAHMLRMNEVNMKLLGKLKAGNTEVEHFNRIGEEFNIQLKSLQQSNNDYQQENEG